MSSKPVALNPRTKDQIVRVTTLTTPIKVLITLLTKSHDPPSTPRIVDPAIVPSTTSR